VPVINGFIPASENKIEIVKYAETIKKMYLRDFIFKTEASTFVIGKTGGCIYVIYIPKYIIPRIPAGTR
jgi:hypothetical protein